MTRPSCPFCGRKGVGEIPNPRGLWCPACHGYWEPVDGAKPTAGAAALRCTAALGSVQCELNADHIGNHCGCPPVGEPVTWEKFPGVPA